jgi:hypothetical protein
MMQLKVLNPGDLLFINKSYLDIYDEMSTIDYRVLVTFTSQFTGKAKTVSANTNYTNKERYIVIGIYTTRDADQENLIAAVIQLGTTDFPLGFYDVVMYQNNDNTNLDTTGLPVIWNGIMNLSGYSTATQSVTYTEYTTNDSDTESIYLTNTAI